MTIEQLKEAMKLISKSYPIERVYLFGSRADGSNKSDSDVDLIIEFSQRVSLLTISSVKVELEEMLNLDVDIVHGPLRETDLIEVEKVVELYAAQGEIVIKKVISEIEIGLELLGDTDLDVFLNDEKLKRALGMTVINIGELIKNVTETRKEHYNIPWKAVAGMRDITAHKYQTLRMEDVYTTVKEDFITLKEQLKSIT